jgi:CobQ-like glutamine amidotransferase family enzyme
MIRFLELYPEHLNLNGDLANSLVLRRQFEMRGYEVEVLQVRKGDALPASFDFFLLGHGSAAAWQDISDDLLRILPFLKTSSDQSVAGLVVASGFEYSAATLFGLEPGSNDRRSEFVIAEVDGHEVLGYLNSESDLPIAIWSKNVLGTLLHGPVLAKNPQLISNFIANICSRRGEQVRPLEQQNEADQLAGLVQEVWLLEKPLAGE